MKLHIENIAKIKKADIDIDGITVIAGSNNTGKSTIGKVLFTMFEAFYNVETFVREWKPRDAKKILKKMVEIWILSVKSYQEQNAVRRHWQKQFRKDMRMPLQTVQVKMQSELR